MRHPSNLRCTCMHLEQCLPQASQSSPGSCGMVYFLIPACACPQHTLCTCHPPKCILDRNCKKTKQSCQKARSRKMHNSCMRSCLPSPCTYPPHIPCSYLLVCLHCLCSLRCNCKKSKQSCQKARSRKMHNSCMRSCLPSPCTYPPHTQRSYLLVCLHCLCSLRCNCKQRKHYCLQARSRKQDT
jgi:hypothetical protein